MPKSRRRSRRKCSQSEAPGFSFFCSVLLAIFVERLAEPGAVVVRAAPLLRLVLRVVPANIHPNNRGVDRYRLAQRQAALQSGCL
jgi:hypothetical protein